MHTHMKYIYAYLYICMYIYSNLIFIAVRGDEHITFINLLDMRNIFETQSLVINGLHRSKVT